MNEPAVVTISPASRTNTRGAERVFYVGVALMMLGLNVVGFAPPLFDTALRRVPLPLTPLVTAHAVVSVAWLLLFLLQAGLVATGRTRVHRRVGLFGVALAILFVVLGSVTTVEETRRGFDLGGNFDRLPPPPGHVDAVATQLGILYLFAQFAVLVGAAFWYRSRPAIHKRLMLVALLGPLAPTPIAHVIGSWLWPRPWAGLLFPVGQAVLLAIVLVHDRITEGRIHPVSWWACLLVYGSDTLFNFSLIGSRPWIQFSTWLIG